MVQTKRKHIEYDQDEGHLISHEPDLAEDAYVGEDPPMGPSVGELLREAREQAGYDIREIAALLRIRPVFVEAIEEGRYAELPGAIYSTGFIRSYAELMGFDAEAMVDRFRREGRVVPRKPELTFPAPVPEGSRVPSGAIIMVAVLIAVVGYAGWYFLSSTNRDLADAIPTLPDRFLALISGEEVGETPPGPIVEPADPAPRVSAPVADPATTGEAPPAGGSPLVVAEGGATAANGAAADGGDAAAGGDSAATTGAAPGGASTDGAGTNGAGAAAGPQVAPPAQTTGSATTGTGGLSFGGGNGGNGLGVGLQTGPQSPSPEGTSPGAAAGETDTAAETLAAETLAAESVVAGQAAAVAVPRSIELRASAETWVQVETPDGRILYSRVMRPGESYTVPADREGLRMVTGNARGLQITVGGDAIPNWSERIGVVRNIALDPDRLMAGTAF